MVQDVGDYLKGNEGVNPSKGIKMIEYKREWMIRGKVRGTGKWDIRVETIADNSNRGWHRITSYEEAAQEMERLKQNSEWEIANKKLKPMNVGGGFSADMAYYSEYDVIEWEIRERQVSVWYSPEELQS